MHGTTPRSCLLLLLRSTRYGERTDKYVEQSFTVISSLLSSLLHVSACPQRGRYGQKNDQADMEEWKAQWMPQSQSKAGLILAIGALP